MKWHHQQQLLNIINCHERRLSMLLKMIAPHSQPLPFKYCTHMRDWIHFEEILAVLRVLRRRTQWRGKRILLQRIILYHFFVDLLGSSPWDINKFEIDTSSSRTPLRILINTCVTITNTRNLVPNRHKSKISGICTWHHPQENEALRNSESQSVRWVLLE